MAFAFSVAGSFCSGLCQTASSDVLPPQDRPDSAMYEQLFLQVSALKWASDSGGSAVAANGEVITRTVPKIQDVVGLTGADVEILNATAGDCVARIGSLQAAAGGLILESRLQFIESGKHWEALAEKLKNIDDERSRMVMDHVRQLKAALPDSSFEKLDAFVRAPPDVKKSLNVSVEPRPGSPAIRK
jgi:hypothetical protein